MGRSSFWAVFLMLLFVVLGLSTQARAANITNGSFEVDGNFSGTCNGGGATGWSGGFEICGVGYFGAAAPPDGNNFFIIGGGSDCPACSALSQTITGLTSGVSYTVAFYLTAEGFHTPDTAEQVAVSMTAGSPTGSQNFLAPAVASGQPIWSSWTQFGYTFQANSTSATIQFHQTGPQGSDDAAIDKVSIAQVGTTVPEPGTLVLLGAGLGCLSFLRYRNRQQQSLQ
jgi:hypothetical protein